MTTLSVAAAGSGSGFSSDVGSASGSGSGFSSGLGSGCGSGFGSGSGSVLESSGAGVCLVCSMGASAGGATSPSAGFSAASDDTGASAAAFGSYNMMDS